MFAFFTSIQVLLSLCKRSWNWIALSVGYAYTLPNGDDEDDDGDDYDFDFDYDDDDDDDYQQPFLTARVFNKFVWNDDCQKEIRDKLPETGSWLDWLWLGSILKYWLRIWETENEEKLLDKEKKGFLMRIRIERWWDDNFVKSLQEQSLKWSLQKLLFMLKTINSKNKWPNIIKKYLDFCFARNNYFFKNWIRSRQ